ncbi:MAG: alpha/beta fold hydrolase [Desulfovibrionaceae bacterium]
MAKFLLVSGAFQGGWVWRDVASRLASKGHEAHTPTLTGCGYLCNGFREGQGLQTYIDDLLNYLEFEDLEDVVLGAHSYSGMIVAAAAVAMQARDRIRKLVFMDAVIPEAGRSFADMAGEGFQQLLAKQAADGWKVNPWPLPMFGVSGERTEWFGARVRPFPLAAFTDPFPVEFEPKALAAEFIRCAKTQNPLIQQMGRKAEEFDWRVSTLDSNHSPMTTHPAQLADLLHTAGGGEGA